MTGNARSRRRRVGNAANVGSRVNVEGVRSVVQEMSTLLRTLRAVRAEMQAINTTASKFPTQLGAGGQAGQVGQGQSNPNLSKFQAMSSGFAGSPMARAGLMGSIGLGVLSGGMGTVTDRFNRNLNESIPISQGNMLLSSQYGMSYGTMERQRVADLGRFAMSRGEALGAQSIGLAYGQSASQTSSFLRSTVAPLVQASGGTITPTQAAAQAGSFLDPLTQRRAQAFGIGQGRIAGQVQNPLTVAQGYVKDFEKRFGVKMNSIDFENMRSPGNRLRYQFKRMYSLTDDSIDVIVQSGLQNSQFQSKTGRDINFTSNKDLASIGLSSNRLGMKAFELMSASTRREARFFQSQEGSMVGKLNQDIRIEDTLADVEDAFSGLIGPMGEFQKYLKLAVGVLQGVAGLGMARGLMGGGGLFGGGGMGGGGVGGGGAGGGGGGGGGGGMGGMGRSRVLGGLALMAGGAFMAHNSNNVTGSSLMGTGGVGAAASSGLMAGGGMAMLGASGPLIGLAAGAAVAYSAKRYFDGKHARDVSSKLPAALVMTDDALTKSIGNYTDGGWRGSGGAGPAETARMDVLQMRRGALVAAALASANDAGMFNDPSFTGSDAKNIADAIAFYSGSKVTDDMKFIINVAKADKGLQFIKSKDAKLYQQFFGSTQASPFNMAKPIISDEANALVLSNQDIIGGAAGDGEFDKKWGSNVGDPVEDKAMGKGGTWTGLDSRMKSRLLQMFRDSGGRVWLGNGWRSGDQQRTLFLSRYYPDKNGDIEWEGKKWKKKSGVAPAAPPGRSMHEIGLAADLEGDLEWVQKNAAKYSLKTFANVNNEPWHVQPAELPNSRRSYEKGGSTWGSGGEGSSPTPEGSGEHASGAGGAGVGGGVNTAATGNFYNLGASTPTAVSGGSWAGTAADNTGSGTAVPAGGTLTPEQVAQVAYNAGFRGQQLVQMVGIAMRESRGQTTASNESYFNGTGNKADLSYGLWQINLLPWVKKGIAAPYTKEQLFDPQFNANTAFQYYQQNGLKPWGIKGNAMANVDLGAAQAAVSNAGLGDGTFDSGSGGGGMTLHLGGVHVALQASGQLGYDAEQLANEVMSVIEQKAMAMSRRSE